MASQKLALTRTSYTDPSQPANPTRQSGVQDAEALIDYTQHDKPLEQIHASNLHGWGIASGLTVTATLGGPNLQVLPGVAVDSLGQHIGLAFGGFAQSTANPDKVGDTTRLSVTNPTGVTIPTPAPGGSMYLTIQFLESFDLDSLIGHGVFQMYHSPWLQLVPTAGFVNDGTSLVLAQVTIDGSGHVTSLAAGLRQGTSLPLQRLSVANYALQSGGGTSIGASVPEIGALLPRTAGGLTIQADTLGIQSTMGTESVFFDLVGGHVGIGTNAPTHSLEVNGAISATDVLKQGVSLVSSQWQAGGGGAISYQGGNFGIGTNAPAHTLEVNGSLNATTVLAGGVPLAPSQWQNGAGGTISYQGGNVGIGTSSPTNKLHVVAPGGFDHQVPIVAQSNSTFFGALDASGAERFAINLDSDNTSFPVTFFDKYDGTWRSSVSLKLGNVGIGTNNPGGRLDVETTSSQIGVTISSPSIALCARNSSAGGHFAALGLSNAAASFNGDVLVSGTLSKSAGTFQIDHPLDPANKYLVHSLVESPDMMNVYTGTAVTGENGEVTVQLPGYFEALNADVRYQVTPIGQLALAAVIREVEQGRFVIKTDKPKVTVCWMVTGVRQDVYAKANPIVVERDKPPVEKGTYIHPKLHGQSITKHAWKAHYRSLFKVEPPEETP